MMLLSLLTLAMSIYVYFKDRHDGLGMICVLMFFACLGVLFLLKAIFYPLYLVAALAYSIFLGCLLVKWFF
jgi:hypothetical protein